MNFIQITYFAIAYDISIAARHNIVKPYISNHIKQKVNSSSRICVVIPYYYARWPCRIYLIFKAGNALSAIMLHNVAQFPEIPVTIISKFELKFLSKFAILFRILQTKMMIFGNTTNTTCQFSFKQSNIFYTVQTHEICPFMETVFQWMGPSANDINNLYEYRDKKVALLRSSVRCSNHPAMKTLILEII